ncbi:hypothetical protein DICPUDRAFT_151766 [Dictyostelium purpureum]|uniref:Exonuclease domain-containing protein n=1 Tax=Dictyostelium purpureum TaxID=5786 RepID=F0ZJP5_DICPU|nr:uncharacterized protein DICPUDRAFT_151766 [Dictyostelium purpureum]EGC35851.1 hypothetical protein DICPUDRAFT_151766 [Dictyostelium purpureum]|eukprot:XP_003287640.1 hypothetical protein DICPUDRAFT_151766 [Dictyostelium purpureum]
MSSLIPNNICDNYMNTIENSNNNSGSNSNSNIPPRYNKLSTPETTFWSNIQFYLDLISVRNYLHVDHGVRKTKNHFYLIKKNVNQQQLDELNGELIALLKASKKRKNYIVKESRMVKQLKIDNQQLINENQQLIKKMEQERSHYQNTIIQFKNKEEELKNQLQQLQIHSNNQNQEIDRVTRELDQCRATIGSFEAQKEMYSKLNENLENDKLNILEDYGYVRGVEYEEEEEFYSLDDENTSGQTKFNFETGMNAIDKLKHISQIYYFRRVLTIRQSSCYRSEPRADTETTGLSVATDEITEISIIDLYDGSHFYKLINPTTTVSSASASIHGHTNKSLAGNEYWCDIEPSLIEYLSKYQKSGAYIIAHNEKFDRGILASQIGKNAASVPSMFPSIVFVDSIPIFKRFVKKLEGGYSMSSLIDHYQIPKSDKSHSSCQDVLDLVLLLKEHKNKEGKNIEADLAKFLNDTIKEIKNKHNLKLKAGDDTQNGDTDKGTSALESVINGFSAISLKKIFGEDIKKNLEKDVEGNYYFYRHTTHITFTHQSILCNHIQSYNFY